MDPGDILHLNRRAIYRPNRQRVEFRDRAWAAVGSHHVLAVAYLFSARRRDQVLVGERGGNVRRAQVVGRELPRLQVYHDGALLPAIRQRHRCPLDGRKLPSYEVLTKIVEFGL